MARRRKSKYTWFPVNGRTDEGAGEVFYDGAAFRIGGVTTGKFAYNSPAYVEAGVPDGIALFPIVPDFTVEQGAGSTANNPQLRDIVSGNDWVLKRIVGKLHIECIAAAVGQASTVAWNQILCTAGFFVARSQDAAQAQVDMTPEAWDPAAKDNAMNPWIWRRTWIFRNPGTTSSSISSNIPSSTMEYRSVAEGGHIDSKVSRRISREHRLWFCVTASGGDPTRLTVSGTTDIQPSLGGFMDIRILGALRRQRNTSSF